LSEIRIAGLPVKAAGLEVYPEADGYVVYQAAREKVHFLNHTAVFVLELCDGLHSDAEISAIFRETFPPAEDPERAVDDILRRFVGEELIRIDQPAATASSTA
jgi:hypothetical protein